MAAFSMAAVLGSGHPAGLAVVLPQLCLAVGLLVLVSSGIAKCTQSSWGSAGSLPLLPCSWGDHCAVQPGSLMSASGTQCVFRPSACRKILCTESLGKGQKPLGSSKLKLAFFCKVSFLVQRLVVGAGPGGIAGIKGSTSLIS